MSAESNAVHEGQEHPIFQALFEAMSRVSAENREAIRQNVEEARLARAAVGEQIKALRPEFDAINVANKARSTEAFHVIVRGGSDGKEMSREDFEMQKGIMRECRGNIANAKQRLVFLIGQYDCFSLVLQDAEVSFVEEDPEVESAVAWVRSL